jgi:hypothetical protein
VSYSTKPARGKCPRCGGKMQWEFFGADCRGNPGGSGKSCASLCYMWFDYGLPAYRPSATSSRQVKEDQ